MLYSKVKERLVQCGVNLEVLGLCIKNIPHFINTLREYKRLVRDQKFLPHLRNLFPCANEFDSQAGVARGHYFWQDLWVARKIYARRPNKHLDIGSRIDGFISSLIVFMPVEVIDVRSLTSDVPNLKFTCDDATELKNIPTGSIESLSALHSIEHFGLGRYGDPIDPEACFKAMHALSRVLKKGGILYFSVPIGVERLYFNAHRVFAPQTILDMFSGLELLSFAAVDDTGVFHPDSHPDDFSRLQCGCGIFEYMKK